MRSLVRSSIIGSMLMHSSQHLEIARWRNQDPLAEADPRRLVELVVDQQRRERSPGAALWRPREARRRVPNEPEAIPMGSEAQILAPAHGLFGNATARLLGSVVARTARRCIKAVAVVPRRATDVYAFLADLGNHCLVADSLVELVTLEGPPGARTGGVVRLRGPIGVRRTARLRVLTAEAPRQMIGAAEIGARTVATVRWSLDGRGGDTTVSLSAKVERTGLLDKVLLAAGGRRWLSRRFDDTLDRLAAHFDATTPSIELHVCDDVPTYSSTY